MDEKKIKELEQEINELSVDDMEELRDRLDAMITAIREVDER